MLGGELVPFAGGPAMLQTGEDAARSAALQNPFTTKLGALTATTGGVINPLMGGHISSERYRVELPSRILIIKNIVTLEDVSNEESLKEFREDIEIERARFGNVIDLQVPRPSFE